MKFADLKKYLVYNANRKINYRHATLGDRYRERMSGGEANVPWWLHDKVKIWEDLLTIFMRVAVTRSL